MDKKLDMSWIITSLSGDKESLPLDFRIDDTLNNEYLLNILKEFYYVTAYEKIDNDFLKLKKERLNDLNSLDTLHSNLLDIKHIFYMEINNSFKKLLNDTEIKELGNNSFNDLLLRLYDNLADLALNLTDEISPEYLQNNIFELEYMQNNIISVSEYSSEESYPMRRPRSGCYLSVFMPIFKKLCNELKNFHKKNELLFLTFFDLIIALKKRYSNPLYEKLYLSVLTLLFYNYPIAKIDGIDPKQNLENIIKIPYEDDYNKIEQAIAAYSKFFDRTSIKRQEEYQTFFLDCTSYSLPTDKFNKNIKTILDILNSHEDLKSRYTANDGHGCYAVMNIDGKKYAALSGISDNSLLLKKLFGKSSSYQVVSVNQNIRYYYDSEHFFNYSDVPQSYNNKWPVKRMFSCCERKLLTVLYKNNSFKSYHIYVKKKPCFMCQRAINAFELSLGKKPVCFYPENEDLKYVKETDLNDYNSIVEMVLSNKKEQ